MVTRCLFGIIVFATNYTVIYRFFTGDFFNYLYKHFLPKNRCSENNEEPGEIAHSMDDTIILHFSTILQYFDQTCIRKSPIKRIILESNMQVYFDLIGKNKLLCMVDGSFNSLIVLKTINLFKSLIKFHLGALEFTKSPTVHKTIDRISASLQYYLNNVMTNQSLIFESSEYLNTNPLVRQQCTNACSIINQNIQLSSTTIVITCKDKIVHLQSSNEQNRLSNSDIFLLLLNNISRSIRAQFQSKENNYQKPTAHTYKTKNDYNTNPSSRDSNVNSAEQVEFVQALQRQSSSSAPLPELKEAHNTTSFETIYMKTASKSLVPFTMYTIPLTSDISAIILLEWKTSSTYSILSELIGQLNLCLNELTFTYKELSNQIRTIENDTTIQKYFDIRKVSKNALTNLLNETYGIHKTSPRESDLIDNESQNGKQILENFKKISEFVIDMFYRLFYSSTDGTNLSVKENNQLQPSTIQILQTKLLRQLGDSFSFLEIISQGNITISYCQRDFPGLVHFALIARSRGRIYTPVLFLDEYKNIDETENFKEKRIIAFELECLSALQRGCTSYTMTDEYFTYYYAVRLQESNGASMKLYKPFNKSEPPGILHYDFYEKITYENYGALGDLTAISCFELVCVHLRFVSANVVHERCELIWQKLLKLDE